MSTSLAKILPPELQAIDSWLVAGNDKVPVIPSTNTRVSGERKDAVISFNEACSWRDQGTHPQIGILHTDSTPFVSVDIDKCVSSSGTIHKRLWPLVEQWIEQGYYIEFSTSGTGLRMPCHRDLNIHWTKQRYLVEKHPDNTKLDVIIELYNKNQFVIYTGDQLNGCGISLPCISEIITNIESAGIPLMGKHNVQKKPTVSARLYTGSTTTETAEIREALTYISPDCGYHDWMNILMAIHDGTGGSPEGLAIADEWSSGGSSYESTGSNSPAAKWRSIKPGGGITVNTLFRQARDNGYAPSRPASANNVVPIHENVPLPDRDIPWPKIKPLRDTLLPVKPFTDDMLPKALSPWAVDIAERMEHTPLDYVAVAAITAASTLIGRKVSVAPKQHDDWKVVPNLWGALVGFPSMRKSPVMKAVLRPVTLMDERARKQHQRDKASYEVQAQITKMALSEATKQAEKLVKKGQMKEAEALLEDTSGDPEEPVPKRYIVNDSTIEKLGVLLAQNPSGLLFFRDELTGWLAGLDRDDRQQDRAFYLEAFNGDGSFSYDRITRDDVYIPSNTLSLLGGITPPKLQRLLLSRKDGYGDDGLVERLQLLVYPDPPDKLKVVDRKPDQQAQKVAFEALHKLSSIPLAPLEPDRPVLRFDNCAQTIFNDWYRSLLERARDSPMLESHLGKYPSLMPSLSCIFHVFAAQGEIKNGDRIGREEAEMAIKWCEVLESHALRVFSMASDPLAGARILLERLDALTPVFKMADLERKRWSGLINRSDREAAITALCDHGYLIKDERQNKSGGQPSVSYWINPLALKND